MKCPHCDTPVPSDSRVCPYCGRILDGPDAKRMSKGESAIFFGFIAMLIAGAFGAFASCVGGIFVSSAFWKVQLYPDSSRDRLWTTLTCGTMGFIGILLTFFVISRFSSKYKEALSKLRTAETIILSLWAALFLFFLFSAR